MRLESRKYLHDVLEAGRQVGRFCSGKTFSDYQADPLLRSGTERQFEIIGEALRQLAAEDSATVARITDHARIIAFRNILIHGYATVDDRIVWDIQRTKLSTLVREVAALLEEE